MKIIPFHTIAIDGVHCPAGEVAEVREATGRAMIQQGYARRAPEAPPVPVVETAAVAPAAETAAATPTGIRRQRP